MRAALAVCIVLAASSAARADDEVGVVVTGVGPTIQADVHDFVEEWLRLHGLQIARGPLDDAAITALENCLVIEDMKCARTVVDARSAAAYIVYVRAENLDKTSRKLNLIAYWFVRGTNAISQRRSCEPCTETAWQADVGDMLTGLVRTAIKTGHVKVDSSPTGLGVQLDGHDIGATPLEQEVAVGLHRVAITQSGQQLTSRRVRVVADVTKTLVIDTTEPEPRPSKLWPSVLLGAGIAALITGSVFVYYGQIGGPNEMFIYPESTPVGVGFLAVGVGATIGGAFLLYQAATSSGPVAALTPAGGYVGWWARF
jgi:hypothetical protein